MLNVIELSRLDSQALINNFNEARELLIDILCSNLTFTCRLITLNLHSV